MGNLISNAMEEIAGDKGMDIFFRTPSKNLLWLLLLCSQSGFPGSCLFVYLFLFCLGVWFCFCFAVFSFKEGSKNGCATGKIEGGNGGAWETNKKVEMVQQKDSLELVMQLEENIVVEMEALGVQGAPEKGA